MVYDIAIVGAGVIGSSLAMHLACKFGAKVVALDPDLEGTLSSSELNAGGVRASFKQDHNILLSQLTIDYFALHADKLGFKPSGYLWLQNHQSLKSAEQWKNQLEKFHWKSEIWDLSALKSNRPFLDKLHVGEEDLEVAGAFFVPRDGLVNPNLVKQHFREEAKSAGAAFLDRHILRSATHNGTNIKLKVGILPPLLSDIEKQAVLGSTQAFVSKPERETEILCRNVINCAGPWADQVAKILGTAVLSHAIRRQVSIFDCRDVDLTPFGMFVDTSGVYFHPEATNGLAGFGEREQKPGVDFNYEGNNFFEEKIWPALHELSTGFEKLKHLTGWAGQYEVSPDESAIIGATKSNFLGTGRVFECHSFSGHGVMHSYAAGQLLAEKIATQKYSLMDGEIFSPDRFQTGKLLTETQVI